MTRHRTKAPLLWGLILIAVGILFLAENYFHIEIWDHIWKLWPLILILWGLQKLVGGLHRERGKEPGAEPSFPDRDVRP